MKTSIACATLRHTAALLRAFLFVMSLAASAYGTTLISLSVNSLSEQAEFVFEGEVISVEAQRSGNRGLVNTYVTFRVIDILKGNAGATDIELKFLGGSLNGEVLEVNGSRLPRLGEHGIYFVESLSRDLINPLLGWSQGHYLIKTVAGIESMTTVDAKPIIAISPAEADSDPQTSGASTGTASAQSRILSPLALLQTPMSPRALSLSTVTR